MNSIQEHFESFKTKQILVIGDVMIDRYLRGKVDRISPEAPVPVLDYQSTEDRPGGAANVALNIKALGATPLLCSVVGEDADGQAFLNLLPEVGIPDIGIVRSPQRMTTVKTRVMAGSQHLLRVDREDKHPLSRQEEEQLLQKVERLLEHSPPDAILFQDYNKGVLSPGLIKTLISIAQSAGIPTSADPKKANFLAFRGVTLFKPNLKEIRESLVLDIQPTSESLLKASRRLRQQLNHSISLITLSERGVFVETSNQHKLIPALPRTITDVCGAGDTVISVATLALASGMDIEAMAAISNMAGGQVCEKAGVVPVDLQQLESESNNLTL